MMTPSSLKTLAFRLSPDSDLRQSIKTIAQQQNITAGIILSAIGSLTVVRLRFADQSHPTTISGKHEILTLAGTLSTQGIHLHMTVANSQGECIGGHLLDGCQIYTTVELVIGILPELTFSRKPDDRTGFLELAIEPNPEQ
jgi:uncharacterized protein